MTADLAPEVTTLFLVFDLTGVFLAGLSGALGARRLPSIDIVGIFGIAITAGVGGGLIRDTLLQAGPPVALTDARYLLAIVAAAAIGFFSGAKIRLMTTWPVLALDALALGNFAVSSTLRTADAGLSVLSCLLLGVVGATGGGLLRDLFVGERPALFVRGEFNALAALAASGTVVVGIAAGLERGVASAFGIAVGSLLRLLSLRYGWRSPGPR